MINIYKKDSNFIIISLLGIRSLSGTLSHWNTKMKSFKPHNWNIYKDLCGVRQSFSWINIHHGKIAYSHHSRLKEVTTISPQIEEYLLNWFQPCMELFPHLMTPSSEEQKYNEIKRQLEEYITSLDPDLLGQRRNLLLALRFNEFFKILYWVTTCIRFGFYETAIRELQYVIDTMLQAVYIDKIEPEMDINTKVIIQETLERLGGFISPKLAQKAGLKASTRKKIDSFYSDLSRYVHGSQLELKTKVRDVEEFDSLVQALRTPHYDELMRDLCLDYTSKTITIIIRINDEFQGWFLEN